MLKEEKLIATNGSVLPWGIKITSNYDTIFNLGREKLTQLMYKHKFILIRGMGVMNAEKFWDLANLFGSGAWAFKDYEVGQEPCAYANESLQKAYAPYDNVGQTGKALGDGEMSWHVDIPLWPKYQLPMRSFYAVSIPDNNYGVTRFADRSYAIPRLTPEKRKELEQWSLLYQSWYFPGTSLTYIPVIQSHPVTKEEYLSFTSFNNSLKEHSHEYHGWKVHGWIMGSKRNDVPHNADIVSDLHKMTIVPENIYDHHWEEQDFLIYSNIHMIHARTPLRSDLHKKLRSFYRMNVYNAWQNKRES